MAYFKLGQQAEAQSMLERMKSVQTQAGDQWIRQEAIQLIQPEPATK